MIWRRRPKTRKLKMPHDATLITCPDEGCVTALIVAPHEKTARLEHHDDGSHTFHPPVL